MNGHNKTHLSIEKSIPILSYFQSGDVELVYTLYAEKIILIYLVYFDASEKPGKIKKYLKCHQKIPNIFLKIITIFECV